ncbi:MAG: acetyl-CoA carboxylase biotin carboxyl carrier protein subunit [Calditrichota bacterium]
MRMKLKTGGSLYEFDFQSSPAGVTLNINGKSTDIEAAKTEPPGFLLKFDGQNVRGWALRQGDKIYVQLPNRTLVFDDVTNERTVGGGGSGGFADSVVSPMPGSVIKVNVAPGETVKKGQTLVIVEAMKMENEVRAPSEAIVAKVLVKAGQQVGAGETLVTLTPPEANGE